MKCRNPSDVSKLDKQLAAEWSWLQEVRRSTAAAASKCLKQVGQLTSACTHRGREMGV
jgi:hypothetical protein